MTHIQISLALAMIIGYASSHAAGILTKADAPKWVLGAVTAVLATLSAVIPTVVWNEGDSWQTYTVNVFAALITATLSHKSQIPTVLQVRTRGVIGPRPASRRRSRVVHD